MKIYVQKQIFVTKALKNTITYYLPKMKGVHFYGQKS